jgi:hypothetical protein
MEAGPDVLELHLLDLALVEQAGVTGIVVEHRPVPVFLRCPQIVPVAPVTLVTQIHGEQPVEVREALFGQHVECEGRAHRVGDPVGLGAEAGPEVVGRGVGRRIEQVGREPHVPLPLVGLHQLPDTFLEVLEDFDLDGELVGGIGENAHDVPCEVSLRRKERTSLL